MEGTNKLRQLHILEILKKNTDENHSLTIAQILKVLKDDYGIDSYRKTIKEDIDLLIEAGYDIEFVKSSQNQYHFVRREFDLAELKILIDAVESSKFISKDKSKALAEKLAGMAGPFASKELVRNIEVERRVKGSNDLVLQIVDTINTAINEKKKIAFRYFTYNVKKEKKERHQGLTYVLSPYKLVWNGDYYYVVCFSDKHGDIGCFRVDRISNAPDILDTAALPMAKNFDMDRYLNSMFRMYSGEVKEIELICDNTVMDSIIDRFGEDVTVYANDMESFRVVVNTVVSHVLFSWIFGFGGKVKIKQPIAVRKEYELMVNNEADRLCGYQKD